MALGANALAGALSAALATQHDSFLTDAAGTVTIGSPLFSGDNRLKNLPLAGPISFNIQSNFAAPFESMVGILDAANKFLTGGLGASFRQPWFNYRVWQSTTPISFSLPLVFVATFNGREEVWYRVVDCIRLTLPRQKDDRVLNLGRAEQALGWVARFGGALFDLDTSPITAALENHGRLYAFTPPGPNFLHSLRQAGTPFANVFYGVRDMVTGGGGLTDLTGEDQGPGLPVTVSVGNYMKFNSCIVESLQVSMDPLMGPDGYPLRATVTLGVSSMGSPFLDRYGRIVIEREGFNDNGDAINNVLRGGG